MYLIKFDMLSSVLLFMSGPDITVILIAALVLFGGKKLPELARGLGQGIREFKDASEGIKSDIQNQINKEAEKREDAQVAAAQNQTVVPVVPTAPANTVPVSPAVFIPDPSAPVAVTVNPTAEDHNALHVDAAAPVVAHTLNTNPTSLNADHQSPASPSADGHTS
jgi:sec-independent protein translocase protein TatA